MVSKENFDNFTKLNITKMEFTVRYTRQITALITDISIKLNTGYLISKCSILNGSEG